jgi:hypothetical protein
MIAGPGVTRLSVAMIARRIVFATVVVTVAATEVCPVSTEAAADVFNAIGSGLKRGNMPSARTKACPRPTVM